MAKYYIGKNNQRLGPFPIENLKANGVTPETLVWCSGMTGWQKAKDVPEVAAIFAPQPQYQQPQYQQPQYQQPQYPQPQFQQPVQQQYQQQQYQQYQQAYQQSQYGGYGFDPKQQMSDQHLATYGYRPQMEFVESIKVCFNKFVDFTGRARRSEYWWFYLFCQLLSMVSCGIGSLVTFIPMMAVTVRRLHDTGRSAWWYFLPLIVMLVGVGVMIPFVVVGASQNNDGMAGTGLIVYIVSLIAVVAISVILLVFCCTDSDRNENRYGPSPKYQ